MGGCVEPSCWLELNHNTMELKSTRVQIQKQTKKIFVVWKHHCSRLQECLLLFDCMAKTNSVTYR